MTGKNLLVALVFALVAFVTVILLIPDSMGVGTLAMALGFGLVGAFVFWFFYSRWAAIPEDPRDGATLPERTHPDAA